MPALKLWAVITIGVILTLIGDIYLKRSNGLDRPMDLSLGILFYALGCVPVVFAFKRTQFGLVFIIWEAATVVLAIGIGRAMFGEALTLKKALAVLLAVGALVMSAR